MIFEVGPRDGLQNEKTVLTLADKIWLCESLTAAGVKEMEAGAFVRADKVPTMADSEDVAVTLENKRLAADFYYLVPNLKGLDRALSKGVRNIALFTAVSDTFNAKNIGMSVDESFKVIEEIVKGAQKHKLKIRGYVSTVWGCPFEGRIPAAKAVPVLERMLNLPIAQLSIGDTIGVAAPKGVKEVLKLLPQSEFKSRVAVHFHDTRGTALANAEVAYDMGVRTIDSSLGGLGGCPFAPGAAGNLATEDLVYFLKENGVDTGIDYTKLCETSLKLSQKMSNRALSSKALQAYAANCSKNPVWDK
ncbi:MAG: hydroxymethylglutaryl-CoA lyase [Bdellovibrionales bacterium]|nr:hydroxymethylglutaryl-CoA lyase [Bdellovibrionales bacterium]